MRARLIGRGQAGERAYVFCLIDCGFSRKGAAALAGYVRRRCYVRVMVWLRCLMEEYIMPTQAEAGGLNAHHEYCNDGERKIRA